MESRRSLLPLALVLVASSDAAKILTVVLVGGSHYLLLDEISHVLHQSGHDVHMLVQLGNPRIKGLNYAGRNNSYRITAWSASEEYLSSYNQWFMEQQREFFLDRETLDMFLDLMGHFALQCEWIMDDISLMNSLRGERFDVAVIDAFNPCSFLVAEKLGLQFVTVHGGNFWNVHQWGMPIPLSFVPVHRSLLTDRMDFWERLKNYLMFLGSFVVEWRIQARFEKAIRVHFPGSNVSLSDLYLKTRLAIYNTDFTLEFSRPLPPSVVCVGGLLAKPTKPVPQELEDLLQAAGENGFVVVTFGSMLSSVNLPKLLKEMNAAFAQLPQLIIWRHLHSHWPSDVQPAPNVKLVDWLPQNDLLGHPKARLLVTHGGLNSLMEAVYHGVPVIGIPLFGDQFDNMVRVEAKGLGLCVHVAQLQAQRLSHTMATVIRDKRYKASALALSRMHRSYPFPPRQRLVRWVEHVVLFGGGDHLRPYGLQLPWYQYHLLDIILFLLGIAFTLMYIVIKVLWRVLGCLGRAGKVKAD
ncbi:UDP-glucuronosyltransferase 3A1-like isoform X2 [Pristis pectinata]|nr:UDP-glucuronosyltransferase 3A1-like isoform X2 [Pristis pectinata]XP_051875266.1 UDP-glucuronosyltransferase 3A1-like isoform X2 [Pristis pectinata]XP_051875267.1 UDP-glucuronosyltransferase 3A1-like isoform X2 [Pristis pectinata]XP_051875268.1 UDP-glucuronosyltransferase 3A1-like isoform X2 [Pristis pectinata]XP_051875269.1 UDP-glucuronosyltransferase 3A1-like isoform X2 [Pristis pectinata]XP_051875270.1 UDP-glucuronosyltransferase 3A1-like isoform X2 [Pristis pectinata]XP_051875271.1 UD